MKKASINLNYIRRVLKEHKAEVRRKYNVTKIGVFGSYVRGEQKTQSDSISWSVSPESRMYLNTWNLRNI